MELEQQIPSLLSAKTERMDEQTANYFLQFTMLDMNVPKELNKESSGELGPAGQLFYQRLRIFSPNTVISESLAAFLLLISKGNPGKMVMWVYTLHAMAKVTERVLTIKDFAQRFPMGVPTPSEYSRLWDLQKGEHGENRLDFKENWL